MGSVNIDLEALQASLASGVPKTPPELATSILVLVVRLLHRSLFKILNFPCGTVDSELSQWKFEAITCTPAGL